MKITLTLLLALTICFSSFGQKKDSVQMVQITLTVEDYKEFVKLIELNVDSKKETVKIYAVLDRGFKTFMQPTLVDDKLPVKPKEVKPKQ
jgi:hypothetical protein